MSRDWLGMIRRGIRKPHKVIVRRLNDEIRSELERFAAPIRAKQLTGRKLIKEFGLQDIDAVWEHLGKLSYVAQVDNVNLDEYENICPGDASRIINMAEKAIQYEVNLLGSGPVELGKKIDWHKDYKTNIRWAPAYIRSIEYNNPDQPSDVKFPWEVSRLQWTIPAGQAYLLNGNEKYAIAVKDILLQWIDENPYAFSVNWACTMEVALRILSWTWLFHVFKESPAWRDKEFREKFLCVLYLHGDFTTRHLERSDVNGNHYTADAAGLVFAGLFFEGCKSAGRWLNEGWDILTDELPRQISSDGVDFEGSTAYHRLVLELFLLPALYRMNRNLNVAAEYQERLIAMTHFTEAYTQPDGNSPLIGDADDARALPFGGQGINDHRYLVGSVGNIFDVDTLISSFSGPKQEIFWLLGVNAAERLPTRDTYVSNKSVCFSEGGYYIMRNQANHVFIDCAPVGLAGRGGHGHNDCLSFEAVLDGVKLVSDSGAYVYTASYQDRNKFRSTNYHNTPIVDDTEINRFIRPDYLWNLHYDAVPHLINWDENDEKCVFEGEHHGYSRLSDPVKVIRKIELSKDKSLITIKDKFQSKVKHKYAVPLHLGQNINVMNVTENSCDLIFDKKQFQILWDSKDDSWEVDINDGSISPSYGVKVKTNIIHWGCIGASTSLNITIRQL